MMETCHRLIKPITGNQAIRPSSISTALSNHVTYINFCYLNFTLYWYHNWYKIWFIGTAKSNLIRNKINHYQILCKKHKGKQIIMMENNYRNRLVVISSLGSYQERHLVSGKLNFKNDYQLCAEK